jgi:hypothetical protein
MAGTSPAMTVEGDHGAAPYFANLYAPPFSTLRWNAGRACIRDSHPLRLGYGPS